MRRAITLAAGILLVAAAPGHAQTVGGCPVFPTNNIWNVRVDTLPVHPQSAAWVQSIGPNSWLHQDFGGELYNGLEPGMQVNLVTGSQPRVPIVVTDGADESDPGPYPIPPTAKVENGSDRHVIVVDTTDCRLYETFYSFKNADNSWTVYSAAIFDLRRNLLRPDYWTSADAAGLPILAGLARYEDIVAGELRHALRFTAPRTTRQFLWPARHYASYTADANLPPMGARFRLKANFDISPFSPTTQIILTGLKRYGMMLADNGGPWYVQGTWDPRWPNLGDEWWRIPGSAFEAVDVSGLMEDYDSAAVRGAVAAPILDSVSFAASPVTGGLPGATLRVSVMAAAPAGGAVVSLASSASAVASIAPSVTIPAGAASVNVPVTTNAVGASMPVVFTASLAGQARQATLTVNPAPASQAPAQQSVAPPSGSGEQVAFVVRTSDGDGAGDIARVDILVGPALDSSTGCHVVYNLLSNIVYLRTDTGSWVAATPGSASTLASARCSLDVALVANSPSGVVAATTFPLRFSSAFRGTQRVYVRAYDRAGLDSTWRILGTWTVGVPAAPAVRLVLPSSGAGDAAGFSAEVSDANGASDIARVDLLVGPSLDAPSCHVSYHPARRLVYLKNTDGSWQAGVPGSAGVLSNPRCSLDTAQVASAAPAANILSASLPLRFDAASFAGIHNVYVRAYDAGGLDSSWVIAGVWGVGVRMEQPSFTAFSPASGSGAGAAFVVSLADVNGTANLARIEWLAGPALDNTGCHVVYNAVANLLYLRNLDGSWQAGAPGAAAALSNARCGIDLNRAGRAVAEPVLTLTVPSTFTSSFTGTHTVFVRGVNRLGLDTGWRVAGTWTR